MAEPGCVISGEDITVLMTEIKDYQVTHGSLIKLVGFEDAHTVPARPIGASLFPTKFPRRLFEQACNLAPIFSKLYSAIAEDEEWLFSVLEELITSDTFVGTLWKIHQSAKRDGHPQSHVLGIFRSDYMLHCEPGAQFSTATLKQVEFNAYSCAGGSHANIVADMHRHMARKGLYGSGGSIISSIPRNDTIKGIANALKEACEAYRKVLIPKVQTCVLFVVQPFNVNICDERPIEYALWEEDIPIPAYRVTFGDQVMSACRLGESGELLFKPPSIVDTPAIEVAVVYMRAGYDAQEYDEIGISARLLLECSRAIKCPSIGSHLTTLKKVQQALTIPENLSRFLPPEDASKVESTFMPLYPLDGSKEGLEARQLAQDPVTATGYVLKPSLEGGGHNIYGDAIPEFLAELDENEMENYILMAKISPPEVDGSLMSWSGQYTGSIVSELGIFGTCLWSRTRGDGDAELEIRDLTAESSTRQGSHTMWSLKTKAADVDEMSVIKGYGCFDSPMLVDCE